MLIFQILFCVGPILLFQSWNNFGFRISDLFFLKKNCYTISGFECFDPQYHIKNQLDCLCKVNIKLTLYHIFQPLSIFAHILM
jgi:hypothetical protein